jgi:hypothetical protein
MVLMAFSVLLGVCTPVNIKAGYFSAGNVFMHFDRTLGAYEVLLLNCSCFTVSHSSPCVLVVQCSNEDVATVFRKLA